MNPANPLNKKAVAEEYLSSQIAVLGEAVDRRAAKKVVRRIVETPPSSPRSTGEEKFSSVTSAAAAASASATATATPATLSGSKPPLSYADKKHGRETRATSASSDEKKQPVAKYVAKAQRAAKAKLLQQQHLDLAIRANRFHAHEMRVEVDHGSAVVIEATERKVQYTLRELGKAMRDYLVPLDPALSSEERKAAKAKKARRVRWIEMMHRCAKAELSIAKRRAEERRSVNSLLAYVPTYLAAKEQREAERKAKMEADVKEDRTGDTTDTEDDSDDDDENKRHNNTSASDSDSDDANSYTKKQFKAMLRRPESKMTDDEKRAVFKAREKKRLQSAVRDLHYAENGFERSQMAVAAIRAAIVRLALDIHAIFGDDQLPVVQVFVPAVAGHVCLSLGTDAKGNERVGHPLTRSEVQRYVKAIRKIQNFVRSLTEPNGLKVQFDVSDGRRLGLAAEGTVALDELEKPLTAALAAFLLAERNSHSLKTASDPTQLGVLEAHYFNLRLTVFRLSLWELAPGLFTKAPRAFGAAVWIPDIVFAYSTPLAEDSDFWVPNLADSVSSQIASERKDFGALCGDSHSLPVHQFRAQRHDRAHFKDFAESKEYCINKYDAAVFHDTILPAQIAEENSRIAVSLAGCLAREEKVDAELLSNNKVRDGVIHNFNLMQKWRKSLGNKHKLLEDQADAVIDRAKFGCASSAASIDGQAAECKDPSAVVKAVKASLLAMFVPMSSPAVFTGFTAAEKDVLRLAIPADVLSVVCQFAKTAYIRSLRSPKAGLSLDAVVVHTSDEVVDAICAKADAAADEAEELHPDDDDGDASMADASATESWSAKKQSRVMRATMKQQAARRTADSGKTYKFVNALMKQGGDDV